MGLLISSDKRDREAVVPFAAHGLDRSGAHARLSGEQLVEAAHPLNTEIAAGGINHRSVAHNIIDTALFIINAQGEFI